MFSLALELGMTVQELSTRMGAHELQEWLIFFKLRDEYSHREE